MLHPTHAKYTKHFFDTVPATMEKLEAIPLMVIGFGVGEGHHAKGAYTLLNVQDKDDQEMLRLLKYIVERLEKSLQ